MHIAVTGGDGFIAKNLRLRLAERGHAHVTSLTRASGAEEWAAALAGADFVYHLAGVNRPGNESEFEPGNAGLTATICDALTAAGRRATIVLSSSIQAGRDNPYGRSKLHAEERLSAYASATGARACVYRLPNVFGKWARPNYNSVVATFCHNIANGLPIAVHDAIKPLELVYVDDVVESMLALLPPSEASGLLHAAPVYQTTVGELAGLLEGFAAGRATLAVDRVGTGLRRALYSTWVSYLPPDKFAYPLALNRDGRGTFAEVLKTGDSGQLSFFTAHPGVTRGGHYHHSKTEKFLVVQGSARFRFRHMVTGEISSLEAEGTRPQIVESVPGWAHDVTNTGEGEMIVFLWANELFDPLHPDTTPARVVP